MDPGKVLPAVEVDDAPAKGGDVLLKKHHMAVANCCGTGMRFRPRKHPCPIPGEIEPPIV
jgi:hypothetical protein